MGYIFGFLVTLVTCNIVFISIILSFIQILFFRQIGKYFLKYMNKKQMILTKIQKDRFELQIYNKK